MKKGDKSGGAQATADSSGATVEQTTKSVGYVFGICYVIGLLVVNLYLQQFGISDFSVLRPKAVFTGAWVLFLIALLGLPTVICRRANSTAKTLAAAVLGPIFLTSVFYFAWGDFLGAGTYQRVCSSERWRERASSSRRRLLGQPS